MTLVPILLFSDPFYPLLELLSKSTLKKPSTQRSNDRIVASRTEASKGSQTERAPRLERYLGEVNHWERFLIEEHEKNSNSKQTIQYVEEWNRKWKESNAEQPLQNPV